MSESSQSTKAISAFENSFEDLGSNFGLFQLWWFSLSIFGLTLYSIHYFASVVVNIWMPLDAPYLFPLIHRTSADAILELIVLLGRWFNELYFGKWTLSDVVHHFGVVFAVYLAFYSEHCKPFAWLICQLNTIHFPMFVWYFGCRKNCFSNSLQTQHLCKAIFPPLWLVVSSYRLSCLIFSTLWVWLFDDNRTAVFCGIFFIVTLGYLDMNWTGYFFKELRYQPMKEKNAVTWEFALANFSYGIGVVLGLLTVFFL